MKFLNIEYHEEPTYFMLLTADIFLSTFFPKACNLFSLNVRNHFSHQSMSLATLLHLLFRLRKQRAVPPLPHLPQYMSMVGYSAIGNPKKISPFQAKHPCFKHVLS